MKLKSIRIKNFKCFEKEDTIDFERLTILTGANSSGKSSILYSVLGSIQSGEFPLQFSTNGKYVNMGDFKEISHNHNGGNEITLNFSFIDENIKAVNTAWIEDPQNNLPQLKSLFAESSYFTLKIVKEDKYKLDFNCDPDKDPTRKSFSSENFKKLISSISSITEDVQDSKIKEDSALDRISSDSEVKEESKIIKSNSGDGESDLTDKPTVRLEDLFADFDKPQEIKNQEFNDFDELKKYLRLTGGYRIQQAFNSIMKTYQIFDKRTNYISSFRLHPERTYLEKAKSELKVEKFGEGYLDQIIYWQTKKSKKFNELNQIMRNLSLLDEITTQRLTGGRFELQVRIKKGGTITSLSDVGFGIGQFLPIIVADLQLPANSTLFVAQPEIHLHPSVQSLFGDYIVNQINATNKNYVIETHSEYFINRIRLAIVKGQIKEDHLSVYHIENNSEGVIVHKVKFAKDGRILDAPDDFFKTYMIDVMEIALNAE